MVTCAKCGKECIVFVTEYMGSCYLCQKCDKEEIIKMSKEFTKNLLEGEDEI